MAPLSRHTLHGYALLISIISIIYHIFEMTLSIVFGLESKSIALIFFGAQSAIEIISSVFVVYRFWSIWLKERASPETKITEELSEKELKLEKIGTYSVGSLLVLLALTTLGTAVHSLVFKLAPNSSDSSIIISSTALLIMIILWLPKRFLARRLDSAVMLAETTCSLSCAQLSAAVLIGGLVYKYQPGVYWIDSATSIVLSILFMWEGYSSLKWASNPGFNGSCCPTDHNHSHFHSHEKHIHSESEESLTSSNDSQQTTPLMKETV